MKLWNPGDSLKFEGEWGVVVEVDNTTYRKFQSLLVEFPDGRREFLSSRNLDIEDG